MDNIVKSDFYGDQFRWFVGVVEDVNDPLMLGRVRVRVHGIHSPRQEDISTADLPWAQVGIPTTEGGVSGIGRKSNLLPGAEVMGYFLDGEFAQLPFVLASIPKVEYASPVQTSRFRNNSYNRENTTSTGPGTGVTGERNRFYDPQGEAYGAVGSANAEIAFNFFLGHQFTPQQSAGIVGNLMVESGPELSTTIKSAGTEQSFGIAQWNSAEAAGNRLGLLKEFASDLGKEWTDLSIQLKFIIWELENYPYLGLAPLRAAQSIEEAAVVFETKYERPSQPYRERRIAYAQDVYKRYYA